MSDGVILQNPGRYPVDSARLARAAAAVLAAHPEHRDGSLSIVLTDSRTVASLNAEYGQAAGTTDVLAFPAATALDAPATIAENRPYLGDIIVAHDYVSAQVEGLGAALSDVLCLLVIHGTLHLLGYEHDSPTAMSKMWSAQERALHAAGISASVVDVYGNIEHD